MSRCWGRERKRKISFNDNSMKRGKMREGREQFESRHSVKNKKLFHQTVKELFVVGVEL